ncbi:MAG: ornithine carbamoyltransferase [Desulfobacteraceae bacterium]|nr:ornithine carbamoyltransferase [Desulfobacteraceae bacterium]
MIYENALKGRDFIRLQDFTKEEIVTILNSALELKNNYKGKILNILEGKTLSMIFFNPSLRTRISFENGIYQLGGHSNFLEPRVIRIPSLEGEDIAYQSERISDMARILNSMSEGIAIRILGDSIGWSYDKGLKIIEEFACWAEVPVINMEDNIYHPCQGIADALTLREMFGTDLRGRKLGVSWVYSESAKKPIAPLHDVMYAASFFGPDIVYTKPPELRIDPEIEKQIKENVEKNGGTYQVSDRFEDAFANADAVYARNHVSLDLMPPFKKEPGHKEMADMFKKYKNWMVTEELMKLGKKHIKYMHCLPCERGMEVSDEVVDGERSAVWNEASNRLHGQKAVMSLIM